ncbi:LysR substrate-binding domain-containing protein, partial [Acinetobacter baumannii]
GQLPDSGFTAIQVGSVSRVICASPDYLRQHGTPASPADLKQHRIVTSTSAWASPEWRFSDGQRVSIDAALQTKTTEAAISTARQGWGL